MISTDRTACGDEVINKSIFAIHKGVKIYMCEMDCVDEFNEKPDKFINSDHLKIKLPVL